MVTSYPRTGPLDHICKRVENRRLIIESKHPTVLVLHCALIALEKRTGLSMLADDEVLLDELREEAQHILEAAQRGAMTDIDPNDRSGPTDVVTDPAQVFLLASCNRFD